MIPEHLCNNVVITDLLKTDHPHIYSVIESVCKKEKQSLQILSGVNDYWCRDFLPVQINEKEYIQFQFDPAYYRHEKYKHLKSDITAINLQYNGTISQSELILDGGNLIYLDGEAIITDRVYIDNRHLSKKVVHHLLIETLKLEKLVTIPAIPFELTGHADGMVRFLTKETLLINDFRGLCSNSYLKHLKSSLKNFNCVSLPNEFLKNPTSDDATGDYLNFLCIGKTVIVPIYGYSIDEQALSILESCYSNFDIVSVRCNKLSKKGGVLHCASWQALNL